MKIMVLYVFGKRNLEKDERDKNNGDYLLQMLRDLSKEEN